MATPKSNRGQYEPLHDTDATGVIATDCSNSSLQPSNATHDTGSARSSITVKHDSSTRHGKPSSFEASSAIDEFLPYEDAISTVLLPILQKKAPENKHLTSADRSPSFRPRDWMWEICAAVVSLCSLVAIFMIGFMSHDKPLLWWTSPVKPNAMVSISAVLCKASLMVPIASCIGQLKWSYFKQSPRTLSDLQTFDEASRGPWGALIFIYKIHSRTHLAVLGTILTVVALLMDPFAQQILSFPSRDRQLDEQAFINSCNIWALWSDHDHAMAMKIALIGALYGQETSISNICPSGACSWESFSTLAIKSTCRDISASTTRSCDVYVADKFYHNIDDTRYSTCTYKTPGNRSIQAQHSYSDTVIDGVRVADEIQYETIFNSTTFQYVDKAFRPSMQILTWAANPNTPAFRIPFDPSNLTFFDGADGSNVFDCTLAWCARTYHHPRSHNGKFGADRIEDVSLVPVDRPERLSTRFVGQYPPDDPRSKDIYDIYERVPEGGDLWDMPRTIFSTNATYRRQTGGLTDLGQILQKQDHIPDTPRRIADGLSEVVRNANSTNMTTLIGSSHSSEVFIRVRWVWLALPAIVVLLTIIFLLMTIIHVSQGNTPVWKSSTAALLLAQLREFDTRNVNLRSLKQIDRMAKKTRTILDEDDGSTLIFRQRKEVRPPKSDNNSWTTAVESLEPSFPTHLDVDVGPRFSLVSQAIPSP